MGEQMTQQIQRTVVITLGELAHEAGTKLEQRLAASDQPREAVAVVAIRSGGDGDTANSGDVLAETLEQISRMTARDALARRGWTLDRLDEIAVYLVADVGAGVAAEEVFSLAEEVTQIARRRLSVEAVVFKLALVPGLDDEQAMATLAALAAPAHSTLFALSATNALGLCLDDEGALADRAASVLYALVATPLRDAPYWLEERNGPGRSGAPTIQSVGITEWPWSPPAERALLARYWVQIILGRWLEDATTDAESDLADAWVAEQRLEPSVLMARLGGALPPHEALSLSLYPQPWRVKQHYRPLCTLANAPAGEAPTGLTAKAEAVLAGAGEALAATVRRILDETPAGGVARALAFVRSLQRGLDALQERLADQRAIQDERLDVLKARHCRLATKMEAYSGAWPPPSVWAWVKVGLAPWRWPRLAWRYWRIQQLARQLQQIAGEWRRWQQQRALNEAADALYTHLEALATRTYAQVDEVGDMLLSLQRVLAEEHVYLPPALDGHPEYFERRFSQLAESPALEAAWAAEAIGGLGQQLTHLDDDFLDPLLAMVEERIAAAGVCDAAMALSILHSDEEALAGWWQRQWEKAAPLWRHDPAAQDEQSRSQPSQLTLVSGAAALSLREKLELPEAREIRWLPAHHHDLIVMRLRGRMPVAKQ